MNLQQVYVPRPQLTLPRPSKTFVCVDYELIYLGYEEALKQGWDGDYGTASDGKGYFLEVLDCSLSEFCAILTTAQDQKKSAPVPVSLQWAPNDSRGAL